MGEADISARVPGSSAEGATPATNAPTSGTGVSEALLQGGPTSFLKRIFSFPAMLGTLLVGFVYIVRRGFEVDPDFWWHLKVGEGILATHRLPVTDPYSF